MNQQLRPTIAPNLAIPPVEYDQQYFNMLTNILRLYFTQNDADWRALVDTIGGANLKFPYGDFSSNLTQTLTAANTPTRILLDTAEFNNYITFATTGTVTIPQSGIYNAAFSIELSNTDTVIHTADVWLRQNGVDVPRSGSEWAVVNSHGGTPGYTVAAANFFIEAKAGDTVELWWTADSTLVSLLYQAAQTTPFVMPAISSAVITLNYVSAI